MSRRRSLSDEERALWTGVARSIKPLRPSHRAAEVSEPTQSAKVPIKVPAKSLAKAETLGTAA